MSEHTTIPNLFTLDPVPVMFQIVDGDKKLVLQVRDGVLTAEGDLPMDEAAQRFVDHLRQAFAL